VFKGLNWILASGIVAGAVLVLPPAAFADCGGNSSAVNVYTECLSSGGGGKHTSGSHSTSGTPTNGGSTGSSSSPISGRTAKALKEAGPDGKSLANLVKGYGASRLLQSHSSGPTTTPTAIGSAFDLGSGPTVLLIALAGTAVLLLGASGTRVWRNRQRP
jgi:hypothetical protein